MQTLTKEQITGWRQAGYTYKEMAAKSGLCVSTIRGYMNRYGLTGRRYVTQAERDRFCRMAEEGLGCHEIADQSGYAYSTVYRAVKAAGLVKKKRGGRMEQEAPGTGEIPELLRYTMAPPPRGPVPVSIDYGGRHYVEDILYLVVPW